MAPINVGLIGYGSSTKFFHLPFILPNPDLEVVAFLQRKDLPEDKSQSGVHCTIDHPKAKWHQKAEDFFADPNVELVIVCTDHSSHFEFAEAALKAGKHVVVEKAFTITSAEADKLIELSKKQGKILTVYQNRRYDSDFRTLQHLINQRAFGKVTEFANHYDVDNPEWARQCKSPEYVPGAGMLYGLGAHSIDQTIQLFGLPKTITAFTRSLRMKSKTDDTFTLILQYDGEQEDLICTIKTTIISPTPPHMTLKYWVRGEQGAFIKNGEDVQMDHLFSGMKADDPAFGVEPNRYHGYLSTTKQLDAKHQKPEGEPEVKFNGSIPSKQGSYMDYYRDIVSAIRGEKELVVKPEQSRHGIRIIELARESAEKGVTVSFN